MLEITARPMSNDHYNALSLMLHEALAAGRLFCVSVRRFRPRRVADALLSFGCTRFLLFLPPDCPCCGRANDGRWHCLSLDPWCDGLHGCTSDHTLHAAETLSCLGRCLPRLPPEGLVMTAGLAAEAGARVRAAAGN